MVSKIFLFLTIILTCAAAWFGYQTKTKLDGVGTTIATAKASAKDAGDKLEKAKKDLDAAKKDAAASDEKASTATAESSKNKSDADKATSDLAALQTKFDAQGVDLKKAQDDLAAAIAKQGGGGPAIAPAGDPKEVADLKAQLAEVKALNDTLQSKQKDDEGKIATLSKQAAGQNALRMRPGLEGEVMAVNQGWNFVVVSIGDRQGAVANSELIVKRGDTMIGKVRITSVEPSTSIADILPDSVSKGQRVMPGDRVIFPVQ
ncbi:MAG: hypothetical protein WCD79_06835 [Chthoniobacteraceae bacterium]